MKRSIVLLGFIVCLTILACKSNKSKPDGGPCSYDEKNYPATLVRLEVAPDSSNYNPWFEIDDPAGNGKDTISYLRMTNQNVSREQLAKDSIAVGKVYEYVVKKIKSGDCDADIRTIRLEKFVSR
jgi:hypothetical protein